MEHDGAVSKTVGSWRIQTVPATLTTRIQAKAYYSTCPVTVEQFGSLKLVASAVHIDVKGRMPRDIQLHAPVVWSWMRPTAPVTITADHYTQFGLLSGVIQFTRPAKIRLFGSRRVPPWMTGWDVRVLPAVRWIRPSRATSAPDGFTPLHLYAAGLLPDSDLPEFLAWWSPLNEAQRLERLREPMLVFADALKSRYAGPHSWQEFQWLTQYRSPQELLQLTGLKSPA
jgi:hypothetical protein